MLVEVNIKNNDPTSKYYTCKFDSTSSFDIIKEAYVSAMDLVNTITDFNKSK